MFELIIVQVISAARKSNGKLTVITDKAANIEDVDCLLLAIGRTSNTADLGLQNAGDKNRNF